MNRKEKKMKKVLVMSLAFVAIVGLASFSNAANIGNWSGSLRSWNNSDMSILKAALITAGNTVEADEAITTSNLANDNVFVIGEATSVPISAELSVLSTFVNGGGTLLVLTNSGCSGGAGANAIFSALGSSLNLPCTGSPVVAPFAGGIFATTGPPYNIVGQTLATTPGNVIAGGTTLAGDYIHYQKIGNGYIFAFGDRSDHNTFNPNDTTVNGKLFLNIAAGSSVVKVSTVVPTMTQWGMIIFMILAGIGAIHYLRSRKRAES